jgi:hypothetical protein
MLKNKYVHYYADGSGRDSYINSNSGGFSKLVKPISNINKYKIIKPQTSYSSVKNVSKESWTIRYKSDGSGRDSYILQGSGGLQKDFNKSKPFQDTLRNSFNFNNMSPKLNNLNKSKIEYVSRDEYIISSRLKKLQNEVTKRLYKLPDIISPCKSLNISSSVKASSSQVKPRHFKNQSVLLNNHNRIVLFKKIK